jgi:Fe-S-cluster containining protein
MGACASLLCDNCRQPGRCCTGFYLGDMGETALDALVSMATMLSVTTADGRSAGSRELVVVAAETDTDVMLGLPFMPLFKHRPGAWHFWCPLLVKGRCSDYENRPALCRSFDAGSDTLCAMHVPRPPDAGSLKKLDREELVDA